MTKEIFLQKLNIKKIKLPIPFLFSNIYTPDPESVTVSNVHNHTKKHNVFLAYLPISKINVKR